MSQLDINTLAARSGNVIHLSSHISGSSISTGSFGRVETGNLTVGGSQGSDGQVLTSTGAGVAWEAAAGGVDGIVSTANSTAITINSAENVGIGVTPESWSDIASVVQIGPIGAVWYEDTMFGSPSFHLSENIYYDSQQNEQAYINDGKATDYEQKDGVHRFKVGGEAFADNAVAGWTTGMTIDNSGDTHLGNNLYQTGNGNFHKRGPQHYVYNTQLTTNETAYSNMYWCKIGDVTGIANTDADTCIHVIVRDGGDDQWSGYCELFYKIVTEENGTHYPSQACLIKHFGSQAIQTCRLARVNGSTTYPGTYELWVQFGQSYIDHFSYEFHYAGGHGTFTPVTSPQTTFSTPQCDDEIENTSFTTTFVNGTVAGSSKSFVIDHPLESKKDDYNLVHASVESPNNDLIYRGVVKLSSGSAIVNIDTHSGMTDGTFEELCQDVQCFTNNESTFDAVKGSVSGNELTIVSENSSSVADVSWMVVGDRKDVDYDVEELKVEGLDADTKASILAAIEEASNE